MTNPYPIRETRREYGKDEKQTAITSLLVDLLSVASTQLKPERLINQADPDLHGDLYDTLLGLVRLLNGDVSGHRKKGRQKLKYDAYFARPWNFALEIDELQHFTSHRKTVLSAYPAGAYGFDLDRYAFLCDRFYARAEKSFGHKSCKEFPFRGGRALQRPLLDAFRDLIVNDRCDEPSTVIRIDEFEIGHVLDEFHSNTETAQKLLAPVLVDHLRRSSLDTQADMLVGQTAITQCPG